jgi:peptidoglycan/LPS O-acetylase OafA/YrhL
MKTQPTRGLCKPRLIGIDLFRGVAAYAVCVIHTDAVMTSSGFPRDNWITGFTQLSRFAVPFFLAASFYLMTSKLYTSGSDFSVGANFKSKSARLLVPYLCWSTIYIALRALQALSTPDRLDKLFQDPVRIIFLGGASFHLYFLLLLLTGSFLIIVAEYLVKRHIQITTLVFLFVLSVIIYDLLIVSGNGFQLGTNCFDNASSCSIAFQGLIKSVLPNDNSNQLLRLVLVEISWLVQCLPYVLMGMLLNYPSIKKNISQLDIQHFAILIIPLLWLSAFGVFKRFEMLYFPQALYEVGTGCSLLLCGISLSRKLEKNRIIDNVGVCSFGIYLMHHLALIPYAKVAARLPTEVIGLSPALTMLSLATLSFLTSWIITSLLMTKKSISRLLFGT